MTQKKTLKLPKLIGHRGVKDLCPENTLESILKAFDLGLSFVEIDVKISKDRVPILLHDDTLDRTTNGSGLAIDYDYENIKKLDAGKFFYKENTNIFVPKLEDILSLCTNYNGNLNIELKPNKKFEKENVYQIYKIIKNINQIDIFFSSFDMISILEISKLYPQSTRSFLLDDFKEYNIDDLISISINYDLKICGLNIDLVNADIIKKIKESNIAITVYSDKNINLSSANDIYSLGVDSIFVDNPLDLLGKF
ncbi:glycerophosphodiester phosphodiesterase family protein [Pelagibacteraceae bacterium]|nr:glycerophosphodiester phosphodiesterase family protein [Pelagibacteraceae bacterium]